MKDSLGAAVRKERKKQGLTQQALGELAGTGLNFVSQLEMGKATVRMDKLLSVLKVLGLELHLRRGKERLSISTDL